jgi:hypothetical protein
MRSTNRHAVTFILSPGLNLLASAGFADQCTTVREPGPPPGVRQGHAMAYDSARGVTVLFGGDFYDEINQEYTAFGDTWEWDGMEWTLRSETGPQPQSGHAMASDSARGVTVLFGSSYDGPVSTPETWEWDGTTWTLRSTTGPSVRYAHAMAFDSLRGVTVLFGGEFFDPDTGWTYFDDTWEWNGGTWFLRSTSGPSPRSGHAMTYDSIRDVTVLFSGSNQSDTWEWDGTTWSLRATSGPTPGSGHVMAFDTARGVSILLTSEWFDDSGETWEWNGVAWSIVDASGPPFEPGMAMTFDQGRGVASVVGFAESSLGTVSISQTWEWNGFQWADRTVSCPDWSPIPPPGDGPEGRAEHAMAYDEGRAVTVMFGGITSDETNDTWEWDGTAWAPRGSTGPAPRAGHKMAYDSARSVTVLFGGRDYQNGVSSYFGDTWEWNGIEWTLVNTGGPSPRSDHAMVFDEQRARVLLFGGDAYDAATQSYNVFGDAWEWNGSSWSLRSTSGVPPRFGHAMAYDSRRNVTVLVGGLNACGEFGCVGLGDTWEWNGSTWTFRCDLFSFGREFHQLAFDARRGVSVLFSGLEYDIADEDTWEWDGATWTLQGLVKPSGRWNHAMVYDVARAAILLYGGTSHGGNSELWEYACNCAEPTAAPVAEAFGNCPGPPACYPTKNRYLSFVPPTIPCGADSVALRVTLGPMPGAGDCPKVPDFSAYNGAQMWVGPEVIQGAMPTGVHRLQPTPHFDTWGGVNGAVQVSDCNIVPCATYTVEAISDVDYPIGPYSAPLVLTTTPKWGDIVGPGGTPAGGTVDAIDVAEMVNRFRNISTAPPRSWCDLFSNNPTQGSKLNIDALDITVAVDAFRGRDYPFPGPTAPAPCP